MSANPVSEPDGSERRIATRVKTLKRGKILFNNRFSTIDCIVRNISATGALLTVDEAVNIPKSFEITIGETNEAKEYRLARLVYRRGMFAGVHFEGVEVDDGRAPEMSVHAAVEATPSSSAGQGVRRIVSEALPFALTRHLPWSR